MKIRLALREEGSFWNAYLASPDTMEGAKLIGSIMIGAVRKNPQLKDAFREIMQQALADSVQEITGKAPEFDVVGPAPQHERAGHS
jgi:hypothetical protein